MEVSGMEKLMSIKKLGGLILVAETLLIAGNFMGLSYINYCYTDLAHIDPVTMATCMTIVNIIALIFSIFTGAIIQKTKSRLGKFRPWILAGNFLVMAGGVMMVFTYSDSMMVKAVVISAGFLVFTMMLDLACIAKYNIYDRMGHGDSAAITSLNGKSWAGGNLGFTIYSLAFIPAVMLLGAGNEPDGFFRVQLIFVVFTLIGAIMIFRMAKPYDLEGTDASAAVAEEDYASSVSVKEMLKSLGGNRPAKVVFIAYIAKVVGFALFNFLLVYQCAYVFGDIMYMTYALTALSIAGVIGGLIAPALIAKLGGRKKTVIILCIIAGVIYLVMGFVGQSFVPFMVTLFLAILIQNIPDSVEAVMYIDAGEYWYNKTGKDTRPFVMGLQNIGTKISYVVASPILGVVLVATHFDEGQMMTGADMKNMTMATGFLPGVLAIVFALILLLFHNVSDKEIERCIDENAAKDAELYGGIGHSE
jgi:Na+/melibiose symporter-like transporter